jgi:hypothetical protein
VVGFQNQGVALRWANRRPFGAHNFAGGFAIRVPQTQEESAEIDGAAKNGYSQGMAKRRIYDDELHTHFVTFSLLCLRHSDTRAIGGTCVIAGAGDGPARFFSPLAGRTLFS